MTDINITNSLITSSISIGLYGIYKLIQHYRLKSSCNQNGELVIGVVDIEKPDNPINIEMEIKKEVQNEINKNMHI